MERPKVLIIYTGGTIGMVNDPDTGMLTAFNFDHLYQQIPEIKRLNVDLQTISFEHPVDSSEMNPEYWKQIAEIIYLNYDKHDGFVVLHGSDVVRVPVHFILPFTSNNSVGEVVLIPNLPLLVNLITSFVFHILFPQV
jgi:L-asparaginase/Glu-tRNA(Gln) amidotransferase subunit D